VPDENPTCWIKLDNPLVDISSKWHRHYFYIQGKYCCPHPDAISPGFEVKFARMEYVDLDRFNLSYNVKSAVSGFSTRA